MHFPALENSVFLLLAGVLILLMGRQLFWLFVAALGAVVGGEVGMRWFADRGPWVELAAIVLGGIAGALIAIFLQTLAAAVAVFYAGGAVLQDAALRWHLVAPAYSALPFLVGGVIGAVLMLLFFNWALIILSSLYGALLVVQNSHLAGVSSPFLFPVLFAAGFLFQALLLRRSVAD